ncbi:MAG: hypothetical protein LBS41_03445 [Streptococcaceae bacterium]|jgi:hypothetical protein|nr:hypothetical protein [Streptococcaceae bacterium]
MKKKLVTSLCLVVLLNSVLASPLAVIADEVANQPQTTQAETAQSRNSQQSAEKPAQATATSQASDSAPASKIAAPKQTTATAAAVTCSLSHLVINKTRIDDNDNDGTLPDEATELTGDITLKGDRAGEDYTFSNNGVKNKVDIDLKGGLFDAYPIQVIVDKTDNTILHFELNRVDLTKDKTAEIIIPASDNVYHQEFKIHFDIEHLKATVKIDDTLSGNLAITDGVKDESSFAKNLSANDFVLEDGAKGATITNIVRARDKKSVAFKLDHLDRSKEATTLNLQPAIAYSNGYRSQKVLRASIATPGYVDPKNLHADLSLTTPLKEVVQKVEGNIVHYKLHFALTGVKATADLVPADIALTGAFYDAIVDKIERDNDGFGLTVSLSHNGTASTGLEKTGTLSILRHLDYQPYGIPINQPVSCNITDPYNIPEVSYTSSLKLDTPSQDTENPQYTWTLKVDNGSFGQLDAANIKYEGGFETAITQSVTSSGNTLTVVFNKLPDKRVNRNPDGKIGLVNAKVFDATGNNLNLSKKFAIHDDFTPAITYDTNNPQDYTEDSIIGQKGMTVGKAATKEIWKNIGEFGKEFRNLPIMKCTVFGETLFSIIDMVVSIINANQPDPIKEALAQISAQIKELSKQLTNDAKFIVDQQQRARFEARLLALSTRENTLFSETNVSKIKYVKTAMVDLENATNLSDGQAQTDQQYLRDLYHSGYIDEKGTFQKPDTDFLDAYKLFALSLTGENDPFNSLGDIFSVYQKFNSFAFCFNSETFKRREQFNDYYKKLFKMMYVPLMFAIQYDLTDLQAQKVCLTNEKAFLSEKLKGAMTATDRNNVQKQIDNKIDPRLKQIDLSIKQDKQYLGVQNANTTAPITSADCLVPTTASLAGDQSLLVLENANLVSKEAKQASDDLATEQKEYGNDDTLTDKATKQTVIAYTLDGRKISRNLGLESANYFSSRAISHVMDKEFMIHDDVVKLIGAASKHYGDDGTTPLNLIKELQLAGFKLDGQDSLFVKEGHSDIIKGGPHLLTQDEVNKYKFYTNGSRMRQDQNYVWGICRDKRTYFTKQLAADKVSEEDVQVRHMESSFYDKTNIVTDTNNVTLGYYLRYN